MEKKIFEKFDEQIIGLKEKNLKFKDEEFALKVLKKINYYSLINGYKSIFLDTKSIEEKYKSNTFFEDIYYLYSFDAEMKEILLKFIFKFENNVKTKIIYYFSEKFKNENEAYLNKNNFDYNNKALRDTIDKLILKIEDIIKKQKNIRGSRINHYSQKYTNIPLWVIMPQLDFGTTSYFYKCCTKDIQSKISKHFYNDFIRNYPNKNEKFIITPESFSSILFFVNSFRNISAHNERLYNHSL